MVVCCGISIVETESKPSETRSATGFAVVSIVNFSCNNYLARVEIYVLIFTFKLTFLSAKIPALSKNCFAISTFTLQSVESELYIPNNPF